MTSVLDLTEIDKLKVTDLKKELKSRGLSTIGNKLDLIDRLQESLQSSTVEVSDVGDDYVNEDEALGEDELLSEDPKSDLLICDDAILSLEKKEPVKSHIVLSRLPTAEKENTEQAASATTTAATTIAPVSATLPKRLAVTSTVDPAKVPPEDPDKLVSRAKRFNVPLTEDARKNARAERFGVVSKNGADDVKTAAVSATVPAKLKEREKRFGSVESSAKPEDGDRLLKRKARFGAVVAGSKLSEDAEEKKRKRAERFGLA